MRPLGITAALARSTAVIAASHLNREKWDHKHGGLPRRIHLEEPGHRDRLAESNWWAGGYLSPILVILFTIFWTLTIYWLIGWRARDWEYGTLPYVPGESAFTTKFGTAGTPPNQVVLPSSPAGGQNAKP